MLTHQRPAIASRYSVPSASTTVEPRPSTITIGSASSCRCATAGWSTLSRSCRTTAARPWGAGAEPSGVAMSPPRRLLGWIIRWRSRPAASLGLGQEVCAPVPGPAGLVVLLAGRALFAVADDRDAGGPDALGDQAVHRRLRPALAERQVVRVGPALVAMALDQHQMVRVHLQPGGVGVEDLRVARTNLVLVEVEVDVLQRGDLRELFRRRPRRGAIGASGDRAARGAGGRGPRR